MTLPEASLPPESPAERIRELLAGLPPESPIRVALLQLASPAIALGAILGAPIADSKAALATSLSTIISRWIGSRAQRLYSERIQEILWRMVEEIDRLRVTTQAVKTDDEWAELVCAVLPIAARATTEAKRAAFAKLLALGAVRGETHEREEARTMAALLEQLEYSHVRALNELIRTGASSVTQDMFWGTRSEVRIEQSHFSHPEDGAALLRLEAIGFLRIVDAKTPGRASLNKIAVVSELGTRFASWVSV